MDKIIETSKLQLESLKRFMRVLGYEYMSPTKCFVSGIWMNRGRQYLSFTKAVQLHNGSYMDWHGAGYRPPFHDIPSETFYAAHEKKLVRVVKLQHSKKKGMILTQSSIIELVHPEDYEKYFVD